MRLVQIAAAALALFALTAAQAQQPIIVKFSHVVTDDTPKASLGHLRTGDTHDLIEVA